MNVDVQSQVIDAIAEERGLSREKVRPSARLLQDLGMDGDDAVEFFNVVSTRFGTDLTYLHKQWRQHFGPEGFSCWNGLIIVPSAIVGGVIAGKAGLSTFWGLVISAALITVIICALSRWGSDDKLVPITVQDVVDAVEAGAWPEHR